MMNTFANEVYDSGKKNGVEYFLVVTSNPQEKGRIVLEVVKITVSKRRKARAIDHLKTQAETGEKEVC